MHTSYSPKKIGYNVTDNWNLMGKSEEDLTDDEINMLEVAKNYFLQRMENLLERQLKRQVE